MLSLAVLRLRRYNYTSIMKGSLKSISNYEGVLVSSTTQSTSITYITTAAQSMQLLASNSTRMGLSIVVDSSAPSTSSTYFLLGPGSCSASNFNFALSPGGSWDGRVSNVLWQGSVQFFASTPISVGVVEI